MTDQTVTRLTRASEVGNLVEGDPFFELAQELNELISQRAYEMFEATGCAHGRDQENWLYAQSEILLNVPVEVLETEMEFTIRADVPGFGENDLEVHVTPRFLCITGKRPKPPEQGEARAVYSERRADKIFRVLNLGKEVDAEKVNATVANGVLEIKLLKIGLGKKVPVLAKTAAA
ncbi:MAG: Hsp20 family protein [Acidobacteriia bacterium]|nr:Hsp20 family protein [Terriglobia bacterium]